MLINNYCAMVSLPSTLLLSHSFHSKCISMIQNGCVPTPMQNNCNQILLDLFTKTLTLPLVTVACHFVPYKFRQCMVVVEASSISE